MESYKLFLAVILAFGLIGSIRFSDPGEDQFFMHINVNNRGVKI